MLILTEKQLDINYLVSLLNGNEIGARFFFLGCVREMEQDEKISGIDYECYEEMCKVQFGKIRQNTIHDKLVVAHRIGKVKVGEPSIFVGIGNRDRKTENNLNEIIEEIKSKFPIWKHFY